MADKQSAIAKLREKRAKEVKEYKTSHDVERLYYLSGALVHLRDHTGAAAVVSSLAKELTAMALKQAEEDAKEKEEQDKEAAEAAAADSKNAEHASEPKTHETASSRSR